MPQKPTACLALADGTVFYGHGFGATGEVVAELVFNTAMTGYQEIMTDPSYASQIVTFTFPHIGNTGVTVEDDETAEPVAAGMVLSVDKIGADYVLCTMHDRMQQRKRMRECHGPRRQPGQRLAWQILPHSPPPFWFLW